MRIIPVIDILGGQVVRGVAGRRSEYRAIESRLVASSAPAKVADAFVRLGLPVVYVADLDAIMAGEPRGALNWDCYRAMADAGTELWIDAGLRDERAAEQLARFEHRGRTIAGVVAGLETLPDVATLGRFVEIVGADRLVFSLDLRDGQLLTDGAAWRDCGPLDCARLAVDCGVRRMIVLDLASVGVGGGVPTLELCRRLRDLAAGLEITSGGGIRGADDLLALQAAGCDAALVASALHDGRLAADDLARWRETTSPPTA